MRIALAQVNTIVGDLAGNVARCLAAAESAGRQNADLVILPEMAIPGYPPRDILFDPDFNVATAEATRDLARRAAGCPAMIVGTVVPAGRQPPEHPGLHNAAVLLQGGEAHLVAAKRLLPAHDVFHEPRWFLPGPASRPVRIADRQMGVLICEDLWDEGHEVHPPSDLLSAGADLLICISGSPYRQGVMAKRLYHARRPRCPLAYLNLCGATDELIFDGRSFVLDSGGNIVAQLAGFEEEIRVVELDGGDTRPWTDPERPPREARTGQPSPPLSHRATETSRTVFSATPRLGGERPAPGETPAHEFPAREVYRALVLGVRDFARKNAVERAFLGLSGGVDSSLVAVIAAEALGPERVTGITIPSRYTDPRSTEDARELAQSLGIGFEVMELEPLHAAAEQALGSLLEAGTAAENLQARLRALVLMGFVNRFGGMLLNTSNKTELSLGYATLYGDMAGTLCPIADLTKPEVYALAHWIHGERGLIPRYTLERPPSAELRAGQVDPFDYPHVAPALERLVLENRGDAALRRSEHKRWQMGVILKVSEKAFGTGRLIPITRR